MKAFSVMRKTLLELWREPLLLGLLFAFPILLILFYYVAFGETDAGLSRYLSLLVLNQDEGAAVGGERWSAGDELIGLLRGTEWEGMPVFGVEIVAGRREAEAVLLERKAALLVVIPHGFSSALLGVPVGGAAPTVSLVGDPTADSYIFARSFLDDLVREFARQAVGDGGQPPPVSYEFVPGTGTMSDFDFGVAGMIVFSVMLVSVSTAETLVRENVGGTLRRLRLTTARSADLLLGVTAAQMLVAVLTVPVTFATAIAFGFRPHGSLLVAMGIGLLLSLTAVGVGLVTACFTRTDGEAANLAATLGVMMVLLSGAMFPMPDTPLVTLGGRTLQLYDLVPPAHAAEALRRVLILGDGAGDVAFELVAMTLLSLLMLATGVLLYQRMQMRREKHA
ncbi:MAG TPA: ABC transporter permease [Anaerolineae bacterium]|nr:ABC transporter permease [Anaerolineae bacterium]